MDTRKPDATKPGYPAFRCCLMILLLGGWLTHVPAARAEVTLVYGNLGEDGQSVPTHQVHVKDGRVSIANAGDKRLLVFDSADNKVTVVDHANRRTHALNRAAVETMAGNYLTIQRQVLSEFEKKIAELPSRDRAPLQQVMNVLHADMLNVPADGDVGPRIEPMEERAKILGFDARKGRLQSGGKRFEYLWTAEPGVPSLSPSDQETLRELDDFFAGLTAGLPRGLRNELGELRFLSPGGGLVLRREIERPGKESTERLELLKLDHGVVDEGWFRIPEDFEMTPIEDPAESLKKPPQSPPQGGSSPKAP